MVTTCAALTKEDGDLDLILENPDAALIYYEHGVDGQFTLKSPNPFAGVSISTRPNRRNRARASFFVDWAAGTS